VVAQLALSLVLLICSGLLVRTFAQLQEADLGYAVEGRALGTVTLPASRYATADAQREFYVRLQENLRAAPELARGGAVTTAPLSGNPFYTALAVAGRPLPPVHERPVSTIRSVTPDYFATLGMTLAAGRAFSDADRPGVRPVALINETLAAKLFPGESALDQALVLGSTADSVPVRIVGVLKNVRSAGAHAPAADEIYVPRSQRGGATMQVIAQAKAGLSADAVLPVLRRLLRETDPDLALANPQTLEKLTAQSLGVTRLTMTLLLGFAIISLLLATVGVYSVMAYSVTLRTAEIGVRIALGASPAAVLRTVVRTGVWQIAAGVGLGLAAAAVATRLLQQVLYEVKPLDPLVFGLATGVFVLASALAVLVPTRRATQIDPLTALRAE
jgi:predicted permease